MIEQKSNSKPRRDAVDTAVEGWFRDYGEVLWRIAGKYETPSVSAEDIVQTALVRAWERIEDLEDWDKADGADDTLNWLSAFVKSAGQSVRNRRERRARLFREYVFSGRGVLAPTPDEVFDARVREEKHKARARELYAAMDRLPSLQQRILRSWAKNRSLAAIAQELAMPPATVRSHKARAIAALRKELAMPAKKGPGV